MSDGTDIMSSVPREPVRGNSLIYVLVTPARNEALFIEDTIRSVIAQTNRPLRWVIVSDGSTDETDEIVRRYTKDNSWVEFVRMPTRRERDFAGKVHAFSAGYARLQKLSFDVVGSLDADISFDESYFELLLAKFAEMPRLGVAGTPFREGERHYDFRFASIEHVSGACQMFRRECFDMIGGYRPVRGGGIDWIAVTTARMRGWQTRTFLDTHCKHHRPIGTATTGVLGASFKAGQKDYRLGGHPVWELFRGVYQMRSRPYGLRGLILMSGYFWDFVRGAEKSVDIELQRFHRKEQVQRLKGVFSRWMTWIWHRR
jgi:glycosyltransferase involved in cell wall biosynthesis